MKKLLLFSFLFLVCCEHMHASQPNQKITIGGMPVTERELAFELYCCDSWCFKSDKNKVLEYIADPGNDINKKISGEIVINGETLRMVDSQNRMPPLQVACMHKDKEIVELLLQRTDVDVNECNKHRKTALMYADVEIALLLLQHGADVNIQSSTGETALMYATKREERDLIKLLLSCDNIRIEAPPLFHVVRETRLLDLLNIFLASGKVGMHKKNNQKQTWFYVAGYYYLYKWKIFKSLNITVNWDDNQKKRFLQDELKALLKMRALVDDNRDHLIEFIKFCIENGADAQEKDKKGKRPVDSAYDVYSMLKKLKKYISANDKLIVKEKVFHALLLCTDPIDVENEEYAIEHRVAVDHRYNYSWNKKQKKEFRQNLVQAMALKNQGDNQ